MTFDNFFEIFGHSEQKIFRTKFYIKSSPIDSFYNNLNISTLNWYYNLKNIDILYRKCNLNGKVRFISNNEEIEFENFEILTNIDVELYDFESIKNNIIDSLDSNIDKRKVYFFNAFDKIIYSKLFVDNMFKALNSNKNKFLNSDVNYTIINQLKNKLAYFNFDFATIKFNDLMGMDLNSLESQIIIEIIYFKTKIESLFVALSKSNLVAEELINNINSSVKSFNLLEHKK